MVETRVDNLEDEVTNLRVAQAQFQVRLDTALVAIMGLTSSVERLTAAMNKSAGERTGAKAAYAAIGTILGAIGAMVVEWFASHQR